MKAKATKQTAAPGAWGAFVQHLRVPVVLVVLGLVLAGYSAVRSTDWLGRPFPGFLVMYNAVVPTVGTSQWPADRDALFHARVLAIDGRPVTSGAEVYREVAARPVGTSFDYRFQNADGTVFERTLPSLGWSEQDYTETSAIFLGFGILALLTGLVVGVLQPDTRPARVYVWQAFLAGAYPVSATFLHQADAGLLARLCILGENLFPAAFIHLALVFPVERDLSGWRRALLPLLYLLSLVLYASAQIGFDATPPNLAPLSLSYFYMAASIVFFLVSTAVSFFVSSDPLARARVKAILPGLVLGSAAMCFAFAYNAVVRPVVPIQLGLLAAAIFYARVGYAVAKHDLFDVDRIVRQSFVYAVLSVAIIGIYALVVMLPLRLLPALAGQQYLVGAVLVVILVLVLDPLRRRVQAVVDRAFYRKRLDYRETITELSETMATRLQLDELLAQVAQTLGDAMQLESIRIALRHRPDAPGGLWVKEAEEPLRPSSAEPALEALLAEIDPATDSFVPDAILASVESGVARGAEEYFARVDCALCLPLSVGGTTVGALVLGPRRSGRPFATEDVAVLRTLAHQSAIAVQNARSYRALETLNRELDDKVRYRTAELHKSNAELTQAYEDLRAAQAQLVQSEKMASLGQLVAGVAHELNNPASFVHGAIENLGDYLSRILEFLEVYERSGAADAAEARERLRIEYVLRETPQLLRICAEGSERIKDIVEDLRTFSRADDEQRQRVRVAEQLDATLELLGERSGTVAIERCYEDPGEVQASDAQLKQVWTNLLANAFDAVRDRTDGHVRVVVRRDASEGRVAVEVEDNGGGIPEERRSQIFDPFFTTKPVGQGTGLGLSIAYGAVKAHGGSIEVTRTSAAGTAMKVLLPIDGLPST